jgi:hypothetical protein
MLFLAPNPIILPPSRSSFDFQTLKLRSLDPKLDCESFHLLVCSLNILHLTHVLQLLSAVDWKRQKNPSDSETTAKNQKHFFLLVEFSSSRSRI